MVLLSLLLAGFVQTGLVGALVDVHPRPGSTSAAPLYDSVGVCSLFRRPEARGPHEETCSFALASPLSPVGAPAALVGQALGCSGANTTHGRDLFLLELSRGGAVRSRLAGVHVGKGRYAFPGWETLSEGHWDAQVLLWATARRPLLEGFRAEDEPQATQQAQQAGAGAPGSGPRPLPPGWDALVQSEYLWQVPGYIATTQRSVLNASLTKGTGGPSPSPAQERPLCLTASKGEWVRLPPAAPACPPGVCVGPLSPLQLGSADSVGMGFHDVYVPHGCVYRLFTAEEALTCAKRQRVALVGDSRAAEVAGALLHTYPGFPLDLETVMPYRVGLHALALGRGTRSPLAALMETADVIFMSSELHDIADYRPDGPAEAFAREWGFDLGPGHQDDDTPQQPQPGEASKPDASAGAASRQGSSPPPGTAGAGGSSLGRSQAATATPALAAEAAAAEGRPVGRVEALLQEARTAGAAARRRSEDMVRGLEAKLQQLKERIEGRRAAAAGGGGDGGARDRAGAARPRKLRGVGASPPGARAPSLAVSPKARVEAPAAALNASSPSAAGQGRPVPPGSVAADCRPRGEGPTSLAKFAPVRQYLQALRTVVDEFLDVRQRLAFEGRLRAKRVVWVLYGYRPYGTPQCLPNQIERMMCLQHLELGEAARAGWEVLDLGSMWQDAPAPWFTDDVHLGSGTHGGSFRAKAGPLMMTAQVFLNTLCNGEPAEGKPRGGAGQRLPSNALAAAVQGRG